MSDVDTRLTLRDIANRAQSAADLAANRARDIDEAETYTDDDVLARQYAEGVEDVLRFLCGDAPPSERLVQVLRAGRAEGDDMPGDDPVLGYRPVMLP